jgi:hypothetical protein
MRTTPDPSEASRKSGLKSNRSRPSASETGSCSRQVWSGSVRRALSTATTCDGGCFQYCPLAARETLSASFAEPLQSSESV